MHAPGLPCIDSQKIREMYHHLASNTIRGPKICIHTPTTVPIEDRQAMLPAIDCLENYNTQDLDLDKFDAMFSNTYTPDSMNTTNDFSMCAEQMIFLNQITSESLTHHLVMLKYQDFRQEMS